MKNKEDKINALQVAMGIEDEGREFYLAAAAKSENPLSSRLCNELAGQELVHKQIFQKIYDKIITEQKFPELQLPAGEAKMARAIFIDAMKQIGINIKLSVTDKEAIKAAMGLELKSRDFYAARAQKAENHMEGKFYDTMAGEEQGHYLILNDYSEYLTNPAGYFVMKERHSLDGA